MNEDRKPKLKTITQEMRERAAQITKIITEASKDVSAFIVDNDHYGCLEVHVTCPHKGKSERITYVVWEDHVAGRAWTTKRQKALGLPHEYIDSYPFSEDLRWLLGEDTE